MQRPAHRRYYAATASDEVATASDEAPVKLSARNVLPATVKSVKPGASTARCATAYAFIKASNVMIGVD